MGEGEGKSLRKQRVRTSPSSPVEVSRSLSGNVASLQIANLGRNEGTGKIRKYVSWQDGP